MRKLGLFVAGLVLLGLFLVIGAWRGFTAYLAQPASMVDRGSVFTLKEGMDPDALAETLAAAGFVQRPSWFAFYLRHGTSVQDLKPGEYRLRPTMTPVAIVGAFARGEIMKHPVSFEAGATVDALATLLEKEGITQADAVRRLATDRGFLAAMKIPLPSVEGYLYPGTYDLARGVTAEEALSTLVEEGFRKKVPPADVAASGLSEADLIVLASLVEAIPAKPAERPLIAATLRNRLKAGLPLEVREAAAYALKKPVDKLGTADFESGKAWTFRAPGLPPGAICSPGPVAVLAAARSATTDALYFGRKKDGTYVFCPDPECLQEMLVRSEGG